MSNTDVTVGLKTFLRPKKLRTCLAHIEQLDPQPERVIVADDSPRKDLNGLVYEKFADSLPLEVIDLEPDTGLSAGRNQIVDRTETSYLLIIDDDHYLPPEALRLKEVLEQDEALGGIGAGWCEDGKRKTIAGDIRIEDGWMIIDVFEEKRPRCAAGIDYYLYDFIPNSALFRVEVFRDYRWDEAYVIDGEHEDFYLGQKVNTDWSFGITTDVRFEHDPGPGLLSAYSTDHRMNERKRSRSREYFVEKWGVKGYIFRGYHEKEHRSQAVKLAAEALYVLPPRLQWELKKRGYLDSIKFSLENLFGVPRLGGL